MKILEFLNDNSGAIGVIVSAISVSVTIVLAIITTRYARLTRQSQELVEKLIDSPEVVVFLRPHETHLNCVMLCIENVGTGRARDVQFKTNFSSIPLEEPNFLKNGLASLERGQKIEHFLVSVIGKLEELKQTPLEITVTYTDSKGRPRDPDFRLDSDDPDFRLDFGELEGLSSIGKAPLVEIADAAKNIDKVLDKNLRHLTSDYTNRGYTFQVGDKVRAQEEVKAVINGDISHRITIPKGEVWTVIQVAGNLVTVELDSARKETGGVVYERVVHTSGYPYRSFQLVKMNLPPV